MKVVDKTKNKQQQKKEREKERESESKNNKKEDGGNNQEGCCIPMIECLKPNDPLPQSVKEGIKFECSNHDCMYAKQFAHLGCFKELEDQLELLLRSHGGARGWNEIKIQLAFKKLWGRKGSIFLQSSLKCKCGKGLMIKDENAWIEKAPKALVEPEPEKKERKKAKTKMLPELQHVGVPHKLDHHYLSSRSPPPAAAASFLEDKYGPITKAPKRTRKETDNSMTSVTETNVAKKHIPIGFAPIESKPVVQKRKSEEPQPKADHPVEAKPSEPVRAWQKVDHHHIVPDPIDHTVESQKVDSHKVESQAMNLQEKLQAEELSKKKENPWQHADDLRESFKISATTTSHSKFVTIAVQTEETCFPNHCYKNYHNQKAMSVETNENPYPESVLNGFDSGINSTAGSPKHFGNSFQQKSSFGDSNVFVPPGYPGDHLKKLSIKEASEMQKLRYGAAPQPSFPAYSPPTINFLFKDNYFALEVCQNGRREYIKNAFDNDWTPMYLSMLEGKPEIGENAHGHCTYFRKYVVYDILKIIGKSMNEIEINPKWGFQLINQNGVVYFQIETPKGSVLLSQEIIVAAFFKTMKAQAESHLNTSLKEISLLTDFKLNESQKLIFSKAAAKLNFEIACFRFSL